MVLLLTIDPTGFAYTHTKEPGYTAVLLGEVVFLIKCVPTEVKIRETELCYNELPVLHKNQSVIYGSIKSSFTAQGNSGGMQHIYATIIPAVK